MKTPKIDVSSQEVAEIFNDTAVDTARQDANAELIQILAQYLTDNPTIRFGQALRNLGIVRELRGQIPHSWVNEFMTEPMEMLARVKATLGKG